MGIDVKHSAIAALCAAFFGIYAAAALAETRAILIGVSDYPEEINDPDLRGPANDVRLMRDVLVAREAEDIVILADGVDGGARPTRAAILSAFADMAERTGAGDLVFIQMSGHGTRQADVNGDETDGLDEVFLPADTGRAEPGQGTIPNAVVDDEIGAALRAIRATGADVWLVVDTCYSGTALRAGAGRSVARFVDPQALGLELREARRDEPEIIENTDADLPGRFVAFYSARSTETARELPFETEDGSERWYGLFTAKLAARLQSQAALSYRQLFQAVLSDMNSSNVQGAARLQTPSWEGNLIDAAVFGGSQTIGVQRFAVNGSRLQAGRLHGLEDATLVGLVADAADPEDAILGVAQLRKTTATRARLTPVAADCEPVAATPCARDGTLPENARFAQILARPVDLRLRLSEPRRIGTQNALANADARRALDLAIEAANQSPDARVVFDPDNYDVEIGFDGTHFWFGSAVEIGGHPVGLQVAPDTAQLTRALNRIRRAETFARLLGSVAGKTSLSGPPVTVDVAWTPIELDLLEGPDVRMDAAEECPDAWEDSEDLVQALPDRAGLKQCDRLTVSVQGKVTGARDVNRVHISGQFCISVAHELVEDTAAPRSVGGDMAMCSDCPWGYSAGLERMFVVVTDVLDNAEPLNMTGMVSDCAPLDAATRGAPPNPAEARLFDLLSDTVKTPGTRGYFGVSQREVWVKRYDWTVLPKAEAFVRAGWVN
jgi:hypothetical protein